MDKNYQSPDKDPVDLLNEHYEAVDIRDDFRRDLLLKTRSFVAARKRMPIIRWAASLAGVTAVIALFVLAWHFFYSVPEGNKTVPAQKRSANAKRNTAPDNKDIIKTPRDAESKVVKKQHYSVRTTPRPRKPRPNIDNLANIPSPEKTTTQLNTVAQKQDNTPLVAIVSIQQPVTNERGKVLNAGDKLPAGVSIRTGRGGRVALVTRRGSELHLDSNSELVLSSNSVATITRGRLYCSNRDKEIARIDTPAGQIKLLGTVVDTAIVRKDAAAVTVVEGKVRITNAHGSALVDAGKRSVIISSRPPQAGIPVNTYKETAWYHGRGDVQSDYGDIAYTFERQHNLLTEVWTMKADGSEQHRVASYIGGVNIGPWVPSERWLNIQNTTPYWTSPDHVKRTAAVGYPRIPLVKTQDWLLDVATGQNLQVTPLPKGYKVHLERLRYTSPDQMRMVFMGSYCPDGSKEPENGLYVFDRSTGSVKKLLSGYIWNQPAWAPDSRHIAISSTPGGDTIDYNLVIIDTETGQVQDLQINGAGASFSPDGKKIAYCSEFKEANYWHTGLAGTGCIFVLDLTSKAKPIRVSPAEEWATLPRWSPDGKRILYRAGHADCVYTVNGDGTDLTAIYHSDDGYNILVASWAPSGDAAYITVNDFTAHNRTIRVAADGSEAKIDLSAAKQNGNLPPDIKTQTDAALSAIQEAVYRYAMGCVHRFEGNLTESRESFKSAAGMFRQLVWTYPLSGLSTEDTLRYTDAALKMASSKDDEMLAECCRERIEALTIPWLLTARQDRNFYSDITEVRNRLLSGNWETCFWNGERWRNGWLTSNDKDHAKLMFQCPGTKYRKPVSYVYSPPAVGLVPNVGDVIVSCPIHSSNRIIWTDMMDKVMNEPVIENGKLSAWCDIRNQYYSPDFTRVPYFFENIGTEPLTIIYHYMKDKYEVRGKAKLLPTGKIFENEEFSLGPFDEGSIARDIDAVGTLDWGNLPEYKVKDALNELPFYRAVAQYEAGLPVTDWKKIIDGEPAMLMFGTNGSMKGSWGVMGSDMRFEYVGPGPVKFYQLKPSGRFWVEGCVKCVQTGQVCTNGWFDKDGKVISTEK